MVPQDVIADTPPATMDVAWVRQELERLRSVVESLAERLISFTQLGADLERRVKECEDLLGVTTPPAGQ